MSLPDTIFIFGLALVIFGPKKLPEIGRQVGKLLFEFRRASNEFKLQIEEELRAAEQLERQQQSAAQTSTLSTPTSRSYETPAIRPPSTGSTVSTESPTSIPPAEQETAPASLSLEATTSAVDGDQEPAEAPSLLLVHEDALEPPPSAFVENQQEAEPSAPPLAVDPVTVETPVPTHAAQQENEEQAAFSFSVNQEPAESETRGTEPAASPALLNGHQRDPETTITHHD